MPTGLHSPTINMKKFAFKPYLNSFQEDFAFTNVVLYGMHIQEQSNLCSESFVQNNQMLHFHQFCSCKILEDWNLWNRTLRTNLRKFVGRHWWMRPFKINKAVCCLLQKHTVLQYSMCQAAHHSYKLIFQWRSFTPPLLLLYHKPQHPTLSFFLSFFLFITQTGSQRHAASGRLVMLPLWQWLVALQKEWDMPCVPARPGVFSLHGAPDSPHTLHNGRDRMAQRGARRCPGHPGV